MPGQLKDIAFNLGVVVQAVLMVVVPLAATLLTVELVRRLRTLQRLTARGFKVIPVAAPPHKP